jgi:hypothetical protein
MHYQDGIGKEPSTWGYIGGWRPEEMARLRERFRAQNESHILQVNFHAQDVLKGRETERLREMARHADAVVSHVWPEMFYGEERNLRNVAIFVDRVREMCKDRPGGEISIWPDINPHKWTRRAADGAPQQTFEAPTGEELRFQIWLALIHGADGICFFPISFEPFVFAQIPARHEQFLTRETALVQRFAGALTAEESPLDINITGEREGGIVDFTTRRFDGKDYVFLVNGTAEPQKVRLQLEGLGTAIHLRDAIRGAAMSAAAGAHEQALEGLGLRIWELAPLVAPY